jgi:hypothetical protein
MLIATGLADLDLCAAEPPIIERPAAARIVEFEKAARTHPREVSSLPQGATKLSPHLNRRWLLSFQFGRIERIQSNVDLL